ncbi:UDP-glucuronosyltransferase 2B20-like [Zootermopsis nevadensis]|uniref:UDP-glucuronosyltransferase 2B20-like n=1 Tax=Zootermopsis nevadensis TaxID=136037 RepID=UPI000B8EE4D1|nr:UDP-glucuronosyltransferase 2B20-like [Zootermopsis nevadensis]XP_021934413.1 UDP-glucuronosyltransferase 2B20-like [Zootermopsis nevadensis]
MAGWWYRLAAFVVALMSTTHCAQILGIFPFPAKSHQIVLLALTRELARRGHQVTVISPFPEKKPIPNLKYIEVETFLADHFIPNVFDMKDMSTVGHSRLLWTTGPAYCVTFLQHPRVQALIHSKDHHFDAIMVEAFMNECFLGFAHKFKAPIIQICPFGGTPWMGDWVGNPNPYSYIPDPFLHFSHYMTFWERLVNTVNGVYFRIGQEFYNIPRQDSIMRKFFNETEPIPPLSELVRNTSLLLVNNHFSLNYPRPLMPNLIEVGGMHVQPPKELPQDLQKYLDESPQGVIYFSMGSVLQGSLMPETARNAFLEAFSKLKQRVLWKWEIESLPGQPSNVKLGKWLPQSDILAHPNVKLFITHGGLLSKQEALTRGVPLLGIPIYGDQHLNMRKAVNSGYGILLEFENITTDSVLWAIESALQPRFRENAQRVSRIFRDQPLTPLEQAVFWTEYVIRHKGAPHMRSAALDLAWYQYFLLDVIAALAFSVGFVSFILFLICRAIFKKVCSSTSTNKSITKQKKH